MAEDLPMLELSPLAQRRQQELLPQMLGVLRWRRRRQTLQRSAMVLGLVFAAVLAFWPRGRSPAAAAHDEFMVAATPPRWTEITTDPGVVARCEVVPVVRAEWFLDDGALQGLLADAGRPPGLVCIGNKVQVAAAAIDRWGSEVP